MDDNDEHRHGITLAEVELEVDEKAAIQFVDKGAHERLALRVKSLPTA